MNRRNVFSIIFGGIAGILSIPRSLFASPWLPWRNLPFYSREHMNGKEEWLILDTNKEEENSVFDFSCDAMEHDTQAAPWEMSTYSSREEKDEVDEIPPNVRHGT